MNKFKKLQKSLIQKSILVAVVIAGCGGLYFFMDDMASGYLQQQSDAETELSKDSGARDQLKAKIEGAKQSEKNYIELLVTHTNPVFEAKRAALVEFLNDAKMRHRFSSLKITVSPETVATDTALTSQDYEVTVRNDMQLEFDAISDLHVLSFVSELGKQAPGFMQVKSLILDRKNDLTPAIIDQLASGDVIEGVAAKLVVTWVGVRAKETAPATDAKDAATASPKAGATP